VGGCAPRKRDGGMHAGATFQRSYAAGSQSNIVVRVCGRGSTGRFFYAGDTGFHPEFERIGERFGPFAVSAMPIGAYEPRWFMQSVHVNPDDAVTAFRALHAHHGLSAHARMVGVHWGTFRLTDEPILDPPRRTREAWTRATLPEDNLWILAHGETRVMRI